MLLFFPLDMCVGKSVLQQINLRKIKLSPDCFRKFPVNLMYVNLTFGKVMFIILCNINFLCVVNVHRQCPIMRYKQALRGIFRCLKEVSVIPGKVGTGPRSLCCHVVWLLPLLPSLTPYRNLLGRRRRLEKGKRNKRLIVKNL